MLRRVVCVSVVMTFKQWKIDNFLFPDIFMILLCDESRVNKQNNIIYTELLGLSSIFFFTSTRSIS